MSVSFEKQPHLSVADTMLLILGYLGLLGAYWDARDHQQDPCWDAIPIDQLRSLGLSDATLLIMLYRGHITHLRPAPQPANSLLLTEASSFILTPAGERFADQLLSGILERKLFALWQVLQEQPHVIPRFDRDDRVLCWGPFELKGFAQPAKNQELVLLTAEELGWPRWFDDPLPPRRRPRPAVRLHDTIKYLNRHQRPNLIKFRGDGSGQRIGWAYR
jgi:hypothetical protein